MTHSEQFEVWIASDAASGQALQNRVLHRLEQLGYAGRDLFGIRLSLEEALVNAIRHGNKYDRLKEVRVKGDLTPASVRFEIEDEGPGFKPEEVPDPTAEENLDRPSGRGLMLMRAYMSHVEYRGRGNILVLEKTRSVEAAPTTAR